MNEGSINVSDLQNMPIPDDLQGLARSVVEAETAQRYSMMLPVIGVAILIQRITNLELKVEELQGQLVEEDQLRSRLTELLTGTANALHNGPKENGLWSWHDLPQLASDNMHRIAELEKPLPKNPLCQGDGNCAGICGGCIEMTTNLEFKLAHELLKYQEKQCEPTN